MLFGEGAFLNGRDATVQRVGNFNLSCSLFRVYKSMSLSGSWAVALLKRVIADLEVFEDGRNIPEGTLDSFIVSLELTYRELVLDTTSQLSSLQRVSCNIVQTSLAALRQTGKKSTISSIGRPHTTSSNWSCWEAQLYYSGR